MAKEADTPPVVGSVSSTNIGQPGLTHPIDGDHGAGHLHQAEHAFLHAGPTRGRDGDQGGIPCAGAVSAAASSPAPTACPMEPPMNEKSKAAITAACPLIVPWATMIASRSPDFAWASFRRSV